MSATETQEVYVTTTTFESKSPETDRQLVGESTVAGAFFGYNPNIATARAIVMAQTVDGNHLAATYDYNASREIPLVVQERTISEVVYDRLSTSFDQIHNK